MDLHPGCAQGQGQRSRDTDTFLFHENRFFYHKQDCIATKIAHDGPHIGLHQGCAQGQRSRDMGTSVMSRNVCYTVPSDVLSLHALTL